jgi:hypothetical protein
VRRINKDESKYIRLVDKMFEKVTTERFIKTIENEVVVPHDKIKEYIKESVTMEVYEELEQYKKELIRITENSEEQIDRFLVHLEESMKVKGAYSFKDLRMSYFNINSESLKSEFIKSLVGMYFYSMLQVLLHISETIETNNEKQIKVIGGKYSGNQPK